MHNIKFPLEEVKIEFIKKKPEKPSYFNFTSLHLNVNEDDLFLTINDIACYRALKGEKVFIYPYKNSDLQSISLFLNGSMLGGILHQRAILPFHGSSFEFKDKGIIICGHSGVGKSSIAMAFCQNGGQFINDDISPVQIKETNTTIIPLKTRVKLWDDTLQELMINNNGFERIRPMLDKFYLPEKEIFATKKQLDHLLILSTHNKHDFEINELKGMEKYNALRRQIYRKLFLKGMPKTEEKYFNQLFLLSTKIKVTQVFRPKISNIYDTMKTIEKII